MTHERDDRPTVDELKAICQNSIDRHRAKDFRDHLPEAVIARACLAMIQTCEHYRWWDQSGVAWTSDHILSMACIPSWDKVSPAVRTDDFLPLKLHTDGVITCADGLSFNSRKRDDIERQYLKKLIVDAVNEWHAGLARLKK